MIGYLLLLQVFGVVVHARPNHFDAIMSSMVENDANLNPGFDINAFRLDQLNLHNYYRFLHGVPAMTRDADLEAEAQKYAEILAANDAGLNHCILPCDRKGAGENLARAWGSTSAEINATKAWYEEVWDYNYCHGETNFKRPGHESKPIGHFTQVIWRTSTKLGIGYARTADRTGVYVVGRYYDHGNVGGQYGNNVPKASYLFNTFQDNCNGNNGGFSAWSQPGECSRGCGGGIRFQSRKCTNPKPSLNGADCDGATKQLASQEWCNIESCSGDKSHREQQCEARGHPAQSATFNSFANQECILYCYSGSGNVYRHAGIADDGTHCNSGNGACVEGACQEMLQYVAPTTPPPTNAAGSITGSYTGTPSTNIWDNIIFTVPNGATNVVITNNNYNAISIKVGYTYSGGKGYQFGEASWMNSWVEYYGSYETTVTIVGVTFVYKRTPSSSTITITGPVNPTTGYNLVLFAEGSSPADISWTYNS